MRDKNENNFIELIYYNIDNIITNILTKVFFLLTSLNISMFDNCGQVCNLIVGL